MELKHYGNGIARGMAITLKNLLRRPITTQYPEERLVVSRRIRGTVLAWSARKCTGCCTCERNCPHGCITIETSIKGTNGLIPAPCTQRCPAHVDAARYIRCIINGKPEEAVAVVREKIPFPSVCAYICAHPCETACTRGPIDAPIDIRMLKRYAVDHDTGIWQERVKSVPPSGKKVAIIGAGPAGLTAAYYLARRGHAVTVFEALPEAGGMTRVGIPDYRLPKHILKADIAEIERAGVSIKTNSRIESPESLLNEGFNAVLAAIGAHQAINLGVPGDDDPGVLGGVTFLREVNLGHQMPLGKRVAVIGGGNSAMDSARTAVRLGATEVSVIYRRTRAEMPAAAEEIEEAIEEGIRFVYLAAPSRVIRQDGKLLLECIRMKLGAEDASGRRRPEPVKGTEFIIELDNIISAVSQSPLVPASFGLASDKNSRLQVNADDTLATAKEGIYAGGDAVLGPATVIEAIAQGRQAAISIDKYLGGSGNIDEVLASPEIIPDRSGKPGENFRTGKSAIPHEERIHSFKGVEIGWNEAPALSEARRCLRCDLTYKVEKYQLNGGMCIYCGLCVEACPFDALYMGYEYDERGSYRFREQTLQKEDLMTPDKRKASGYAHPEVEKDLPKQTLLIDRDK